MNTPHPAMPRPCGVRVTGMLLHDAELAMSTGREPHALLTLVIQPPQGLPYWARMDIGPDVADHMRAQRELPHLRKGALVSLAGLGSGTRTDHGHAVHTLTSAHGLVVTHTSIPREERTPC